jgi:lipopolysaccharide/colanic/teichoic acid biosynthesis glycosyltransferase
MASEIKSGAQDGKDTESTGDVRPAGLRLFFAIISTLILLPPTWLGLGSKSPSTVILQAVNFILLVFCVAYLLQATGMRQTWFLRTAFLLGGGLSLLRWGFGILTGNTISLCWVVLAVISAFTGGILYTSLNAGLWEDNFHPGRDDIDEVIAIHKRSLGKVQPFPISKRLFDFLVAFFGIILSSPIWILISFLIWFEDPGPLLFVKNSVGRGGRNFRQYKFRSMVRDAEKETGPILASEDDTRLLHIGYILRKTAMDELPQLLNILSGEMSLVGPRPQRTVLVLEYLRQMPEYAERHRVPPGISGLAQVVGSYYITPRQKLRLDRLYVSHASLGFDLKLLMIAILVVFYLRWKKDWSGRIPRKWLRFGA